MHSINWLLPYSIGIGNIVKLNYMVDLKKSQYVKADIVNNLGDSTPYTASYYVRLDSIHRFVDEMVSFRLGDEVTFGTVSDFSFPSDVPPFFKVL